MDNATLQVLERTEKPQKVRKDGFTPGVIYGEGIEKGISIKFEMTKLKQLLTTNIKNAKLYVQVGKDSKYCIIKEYQRRPITGEIIHMDFQSVLANEIVKLKVPVMYTGTATLEFKNLVLQINISELELEGRVNLLPETIEIDISEKNVGDKIVLKDLELASNIKIHADENEILAVIVAPKVYAEEETTETTETPEIPATTEAK